MHTIKSPWICLLGNRVVEIMDQSIACGSPLAVERLKRLEKSEKQANFLRPAAREGSKNNQLHSASYLISQLLPHKSYRINSIFPCYGFRIQPRGN